MTGRNGENAFDVWSWVHFASGGVLATVVGNWWLGIALLVLYEFVEAGLRRVRLQDGGLFEYESWKNILTDLVVGLAGFAAVHVTLDMLGHETVW
jgi:hypothetical protein